MSMLCTVIDHLLTKSGHLMGGGCLLMHKEPGIMIYSLGCTYVIRIFIAMYIENFKKEKIQQLTRLGKFPHVRIHIRMYLHTYVPGPHDHACLHWPLPSVSAVSSVRPSLPLRTQDSVNTSAEENLELLEQKNYNN